MTAETSSGTPNAPTAPVLGLQVLQEMDVEIREKFNGLKTRGDYMRYVTRCGAGTIIGGYLHVRPESYRALDEKMKQWAIWHGKRDRFDPSSMFAEMKARLIEIAKQKRDVKTTYGRGA